jgi:hypothetical protein
MKPGEAQAVIEGCMSAPSIGIFKIATGAGQRHALPNSLTLWA